MRQGATQLRLSLAAAARRSPLLAPSFRATRARMLASPLGSTEGRLLSSLVRPGTVAIDVGANLGQYSVVMAQALRGDGFVLAFEPNPLAYEELLRGVRRMRILPMPLALSSQAGTSTLTVPTDEDGELQIQLGSLSHREGGGGSRQFEVRVQTLDAYLPLIEAPVSVIKVDVEGFELEVLRGAKGLRERERPPLVLEIEHRHQPQGQSAQEVVSWLLSRDYTVKGVTTAGLIDWREALDRQAAYVHGATETPSADYVNNFLCRPVRV